jgi:hypothetical protein
VGLQATGIPGARGKTVTASIDTVRDLERMTLIFAFDGGKIPVGARFGGLRGGSARVTKTATVLDHLTYVPGVQLTGAIPNNLLLRDRGSAATLRVGGTAASAGSLRLLPGHRIEGILAGRHFAALMPAQAASTGPGQTEWPEPAPVPTSSPLTRPR